MKNIDALLGIRLEAFNKFPLLADHVVDQETKRSLSQNIRRLEALSEAIPDEMHRDIPKEVVDKILRKVISEASKDVDASVVDWSMRELRIVSYYLKRLRDHKRAFHYALDLLNRNWRDLYINGLKSFLLSSWNEIEVNYRKAACRLLQRKLGQYNGNVHRYIIMQDHANLFDEDGPIRLASIASAKNKDLTETPTLLGCKPSSFNLSYFSDVIIHYVKIKKITDTSFIGGILSRHNMDRTKKLLIADLVEQAEMSVDAEPRTLLCKWIGHVLGDVTQPANWAPFPGATEGESRRLRKAMEHVVLWLTQEVIETFFEVCVQDRARKEFWLHYTQHISCFRIVGSSYVSQLLQGNPRIGNVFQSYYIETSGSPKAQTSALVLFVRDKMIVEFSDVGALYVYNADGEMVKLFLHGCRLSSTKDLKTSHMGTLIDVDRRKLYEEGRMVHSGNWQDRLGQWMYALLSSSRGHSSLSTTPEYGKIFAPVSLRLEEDINGL